MIRILLLILLASCAGTHLPPGPLSEQILTARPGKPCLSHRSYVLAGKTWVEKIIQYDLEDALVREAMFEMQFICNIGGKLYKVCLDAPGFCRVSYERNFFSKKPVLDFIPIKEKYDFLVQARTTCFSQLKREFDEID